MASRCSVALASVLGCLMGASTAAPTNGGECKPVVTQAGFDLDAYYGKWYIQQQMEILPMLPSSRNYCVTAEYSRKGSSLLGWQIAVHNRDQSADGTVHDSTKDLLGVGLCAKATNASSGKLEVGPCFLPPALSGPYWVLQFDAAEGWAIVVGGQPSIPTHDGLCQTARNSNNGLWIFSRKQQRNETVVDLARAVATRNGIDVAVLNDVDQTNCTASQSKPQCGAVKGQCIGTCPSGQSCSGDKMPPSGCGCIMLNSSIV